MKIECTNLIKAIEKKNLRFETIAESLHMDVDYFVSKLLGDQKFSIEEAFLIKELYFPDDGLMELFSEYQAYIRQ